MDIVVVLHSGRSPIDFSAVDFSPLLEDAALLFSSILQLKVVHCACVDGIC